MFRGIFLKVPVTRGFTLIELVVVITILGILAAFAIPRFASLDSSARISAINALEGSVKSASELAHSEYIAAGTTPTSVTMEGQTITLANGYPDVAGLPLALQDLTGFSTSTASTTLTFTVNGAPTPSNCSFTYTAAVSATSPPVITTPITSGC
jgi:MSHA pilin protein MshA